MTRLSSRNEPEQNNSQGLRNGQTNGCDVTGGCDGIIDSCESGKQLSIVCNECIDINECRKGQHNCQTNEECINSRPGYECKPLPPTQTSTTSTTFNGCLSRCINECMNERRNSVQTCRLGWVLKEFDQESSNECHSDCRNKCNNEVDRCKTGEHNCQPNHECINIDSGFQCGPAPSTTALITDTTATTKDTATTGITGTTGTTAISRNTANSGSTETTGKTVTTWTRVTNRTAITTETYETTENAMTANSSNQVGVLVGAIVASIIFTSMIFLIIYFYKRRNRTEKNTQTTFNSTEKGSHDKQSRISKFSQSIYDEPYEAYLSPMKSTFKNRTISF